MTQFRIIFITLISLIAFASNSILTRAALDNTAIDAASFTLLRIVSGALFLAAFIFFKKSRITQSITKQVTKKPEQGCWLTALALFIYALSFSYGYGIIAAGTGALILFGSVQITMTLVGYYEGERLNTVQVAGFITALLGLIILMLPGIAAPSLLGAMLMAISGIAWGIYTLRGRGISDPSQATANNFIKAAPMAIVLWLVIKSVSPESISFDQQGVTYALLAGVVTSAIGYIIWYSVLPALKASQAAIVQLSVPLIVTLSGAVLLNEMISLRIVIASMAILLGTLLVLKFKTSAAK